MRPHAQLLLAHRPFHARALVALGVLLACLVAAVAAPSARAASVDNLYEGVVAGQVGDESRAAVVDEALRQVAVRATGRRAAAAEPALAGLFADARRYVQTVRAVAPGQLAIGFDADAVEAALVRAGQPLWSRERPLTFVWAVTPQGELAGPVDSELRREIDRTARQRGLPIAWPVAADPQRTEDVLAGRLEVLVEEARAAGGDAALVGRPAGGSYAWSWSGAAGAGQATGSAADALHALADRYAGQFATAQGYVAVLAVTVRGAADLRGYAQAQAALESLPGVRGVSLEEAAGTTLRFRVGFRGTPGALERAALQGGRLAADPGVEGEGTLRFVLRP